MEAKHPEAGPTIKSTVESIANAEAVPTTKTEDTQAPEIDAAPAASSNGNIEATPASNPEESSTTNSIAKPTADPEATPSTIADESPVANAETAPTIDSNVEAMTDVEGRPQLDADVEPIVYSTVATSTTNPNEKPEANPVRLTSIHIPRIGIPELALHRRGNHWFLVSPRGYGMAQGWKLFSRLNHLQPSDSAPDPPASHPHLHPRFWMRNGMDWADEIYMINFDNIFESDPQVFRDTGLRRKVKIYKKIGAANVEEEVEERLVEVLLKEEQLSHRCAWCGGWEYSYAHSTRHKKTGKGKDGRPMYWCGDCSRAPKPLSTFWWQRPEKLHDLDYFNYKLP